MSLEAVSSVNNLNRMSDRHVLTSLAHEKGMRTCIQRKSGWWKQWGARRPTRSLLSALLPTSLAYCPLRCKWEMMTVLYGCFVLAWFVTLSVAEQRRSLDNGRYGHRRVVVSILTNVWSSSSLDVFIKVGTMSIWDMRSCHHLSKLLKAQSDILQSASIHWTNSSYSCWSICLIIQLKTRGTLPQGGFNCFQRGYLDFHRIYLDFHRSIKSLQSPNRLPLETGGSCKLSASLDCF